MRFILLLLACPVCAQVTTGAISGYVLDPNQRPVPGAEVRAQNVATGWVRTARSDGEGFYLLAELAPASYAVTASAGDFEPAAEEVRVAVNSRARADLYLRVKGLRQSVEVRGSMALLDPSAAALGTVLDQSRIESLPLNRREFLQLALLVPGVAPPVEDSELSTRGSFAMHAGGAREEHNNFLIDGVDNNEHYLGTFALQPPVDSIQEFKILTSVPGAEYGRSAGGQVNVITRGGGNQFHGALYEYLRNRRLDARNFFDRPQTQKLIRNQFGGSAGGPVVKDRTFFFVNADALEERRGLSRLAAVPGPDERAGDFSRTGVAVVDPFTRQPFAGNRIPAGRIARLAGPVLELFPLPNLAAAGNNYLAQPVLAESLVQVHARLDHQLTRADQLGFRHSFGAQDLDEPYTEELAAVPGFGDAVTNSAHNAMAHHSRAFSARTFHSLRLGFGRTFREVLPQNHAVDVGQRWGVDWLRVRPRDFGYPLINIAGYSPVGDATQLPISRHVDSYQLIEGLSAVRGRHELKAGGEVRHQRLVGFLDYFARGSLSFSGAISGSGLSDLLLGFPSFGIQATFDNRQALRATAYAAYLQDDWKVTPRLTLNLGLRYEVARPPVDPSDQMSAFDPATGRVVRVGTGGISRSGLRQDSNNFAPRVGLAWRAAERLVVRGGYGVYYDSGMLVVNSSLYFNPPFFNVRVFFPTQASLITLNDPFHARGGITPPPSPNTLSPDLTSTYIQQWNLAVQRQIGAETTVSVAYAGSKGTHLVRARDLNQPLPGPGDVAVRRPNRAFGGVFFIESGANSSFHSMQAAVDRRLRRGVSLLGSYTRSRTIDDASAFLGNRADKNFPQDSRNIRAERALASFDVTNRLVAAAVYASPGRRWWTRGAELRGIVTAQSGQPFTPLLRFDNSNTGNTGGIFGSDRPDVLRNPALDSPRPERWFDTAAFAIPARYRFGNAGRNIVRGPALVNFDIAVSRRFVLREDINLTADVQSFNLFNRAHFNSPEHFADEPATFGRVFSAKAPRQLQVALRVRW